MILALLIEAHDKMGHNGAGCTYALLKRYYYWKGIKNFSRQTHKELLPMS